MARPKNSRAKTSIFRAQRKLDELSEQAVEIYEQILFNDYEALGLSDSVPIKVRLDLAKDILARTIGNDKILEHIFNKKAEADGEGTEEESTPVFSIVAQ